MSPDGLSYLDIASETAAGGPANLVNGYWSPGYPAVMGAALALLRPAAVQEFAVLQLANFVMFTFAVLAFAVLVRASLEGRQEKALLVPFAFCTFLWFTVEFIGLRAGPDLGVGAVVFLAAGICWGLVSRGSTGKDYVALGVALGAGYYIKTALLPLGLALLLLLLLWPPEATVRRRGILLAAGVFLAIAAPYVALLSVQLGRFSIGEAGRLNYAWFVNRLPMYAGWAGGPHDPHGMAEHPPRALVERPVTLEFSSPLRGTYPLWYDPSYWHAGARTRFDLRQQLAALREGFSELVRAALRMNTFAAGALALLLLSARRIAGKQTLRRYYWQLGWPLAACAMYALVCVEYRYLGAFFALFWLGVYGLLGSGIDAPTRKWVLRTVMCAAMISSIVRQAAPGPQEAGPADHRALAETLHSLGLREGDRLAVVGPGFREYYARLARLRIVAEIRDGEQFWRLTPPEVDRLAERLASVGVRAIVARDRPGGSEAAPWRDVPLFGASRVSVLLLPGS
jgi:hypothetical protein